MSNKDFNKLWDADKLIRTLPLDPCPEGHCTTILSIEFIRGFELFNTRSYHNYDSWGDGYRVSDGKITVEAEDLDDALKLFELKIGEKK